MNKKIKIALIIVLAILAISIFYIVFQNQNKNKQAPYSVVYLTTNEIYIGRLSRQGAKLTLTDVYLLQIVKDPQDETKSSFQLSPLKEAIWAPKEIYINKDKVIFYGPIEETSKVAETIKAAKK